jgi:hypothetical protein
MGGSGECVTDSEIFEIGPVVTTPDALFVREADARMPAPFSVDPGVAWHALGTRIDPSAFVQIERRTE